MLYTVCHNTTMISNFMFFAYPLPETPAPIPHLVATLRSTCHTLSIVYIRFPVLAHFREKKNSCHDLWINRRISSEGRTVEPVVAAVQRHSLTPTTWTTSINAHVLINAYVTQAPCFFTFVPRWACLYSHVSLFSSLWTDTSLNFRTKSSLFTTTQPFRALCVTSVTQGFANSNWRTIAHDKSIVPRPVRKSRFMESKTSSASTPVLHRPPSRTYWNQDPHTLFI
jgi:hypothetical protein